jgi:hypothetical protein
MSDPVTHDQAASIAASIDWIPTCLPGQEQRAIVEQVLRAAGVVTGQPTFVRHPVSGGVAVVLKQYGEGRWLVDAGDGEQYAEAPDFEPWTPTSLCGCKGCQPAGPATSGDAEDHDSEDESDLALLRTLVGPRKDLPFGVWAEQTMHRILTRMEQLSEAITEEQQ